MNVERAERAKVAIKSLLIAADVDLTRHSPYRHIANLLTQLSCETLLDVGANYGQYATLVRRAGFAGRIVSYEPVTEVCRKLQQRARRDPSWTVECAALGAREHTASINVTANTYSSSLRIPLGRHLQAAPDSAVVATQEVPVLTLAAEIERLGLQASKSFLKIDTQGYESEVLKGTEPHLNSLLGVQIELSVVPLYEGQSLLPDLLEELSDRGLALWRIEPGFSAEDGRMLQCDGIFVRQDLLS